MYDLKGSSEIFEELLNSLWIWFSDVFFVNLISEADDSCVTKNRRHKGFTKDNKLDVNCGDKIDLTVTLTYYR